KNQDIYCIEANPRGSRTLPFLSKAYGISLPQLAVDAMLGETISPWDRETSNHFCVKQSTFPFDRYLDDNIILGPRMRSTGETLGIDKVKESAIVKSYLGNYPNINKTGVILFSLPNHSKAFIIPYLRPLHKLGYQFIGTSGTSDFIRKQGVDCKKVDKIDETVTGTGILETIKSDSIQMVFNIPSNSGQSQPEGEYIRNMATIHGIPCFTRVENIKALMEALIGHDQTLMPISLQELN
ncbi:hypothetical protein HON22_03430, partial [Candidatus Peregrinibacteria bacterium]|nr:hypothetical protein [Candidatus Peregrinibacteria bacterium]